MSSQGRGKLWVAEDATCAVNQLRADTAQFTCSKSHLLPQVAEGKPNKKPPKAVTGQSKTNRNEGCLEEAYVLWERKVSSSPETDSLPEKTGDTISESPKKSIKRLLYLAVKIPLVKPRLLKLAS